ncbi:MAG: DNA alkylation repair protein [Planctomycetota bacterium]|nr:DNA alkylation repair protein [Planctomycetota bacterium]
MAKRAAAATAAGQEGAARKGARRMADVTPAVRARLNRGEIEALTLSEILTVDFAKLIRAAAPEIDPRRAARVGRAGGIIARMRAAGVELLEHGGIGMFDGLAAHRSDTVRGWAAYLLAEAPGLTLAERLKRVKPLADDANAGVREWAWIALRPHVAADLPGAIRALWPWTGHRSANVRRYASEITRPRGVWCAHLNELKRDPTSGLVLLEPLRADGAKYVQDSVANWLNDAGKSHPEWVRGVCARWERESESAATARICRRALRSL